MPKPLKVASLAHSVPKPLKAPNLARSFQKPLKEPSLARSVPKPLSIFVRRTEGEERVQKPGHSSLQCASTPFPLVVKGSEVK